jgi:hypothetical protein
VNGLVFLSPDILEKIDVDCRAASSLSYRVTENIFVHIVILHAYFFYFGKNIEE